jgi:tripartite-type tricarboxylate transporter receptor subunit TctC
VSRRLLLGSLPLLAAPRAFAQAPQAAFPNRPLRIVLPVAPGGSGDIVARIVGQGITERLGQPVVVEPRPGAGGMIATQYVAQSPGDGHVMIQNSLSGAVLNVAMQERPPIDVRKSLTAVSVLGMLPQVIVVNPSLPVRTLGELLAFMRANPGRVTYASSGPGTVLHLGGIMLAMRAGTTAEHVPYRGAGPALQDVIAGNVNMMVEGVPSLLPFIRGGQLRALAIAQPTRHPNLPDVPTTAEAGLPDFNISNWLALFVSSATPAPVLKQLEEAIVATMRTDSVRARLAEAGLDAVGSTSEEAEAFWDREIAKWMPVVAAAGVKA